METWLKKDFQWFLGYDIRYDTTKAKKITYPW